MTITTTTTSHLLPPPAMTTNPTPPPIRDNRVVVQLAMDQVGALLEAFEELFQDRESGRDKVSRAHLSVCLRRAKTGCGRGIRLKVQGLRLFFCCPTSFVLGPVAWMLGELRHQKCPYICV